MIRIPFMPPLNSWWRLTGDVNLPRRFVDAYDNNDLMDHVHGLPGYHGYTGTDNYYTWRRTQLPDQFLIPAGTVISFNRYHASNSGDVTMTLQFIASPDALLTPKKRGGKGKGPMRFYVNLDEFNLLGELEAMESE
jgi:hypothetical protein